MTRTAGWRLWPRPDILLGSGHLPLPLILGGKTHLRDGPGSLPWLRQPRILVLIVIVTVLGLALIAVARSILVRPGRRVGFQLLPSPGFEPSFEDVRRFASSLQGGTSLPRRILGLPEPVILRLRRAAPGETVFMIEVPARLARRVRAACYPGVEVLEAEPDPRRARPRGQAAAEMVLRRSSLRPLRRVPLAPDPKGALCPVLDCLRPGEEAEVVLALWRAEGSWHRYLARARRAPAGAGLAAAVLAELKGRPAPRGRGPNLPDKAAGEPVFRARLILRVVAESRRRARGLLADLCSGLEVLAGENSLRRVGALRALPGAGIPSPRRLARGSLRPRRAQFVALHEVAGFLHPPSASCRGAHIARTEAAPAPPGLPAYELPGPRRRADRPGEDTVLPLGWVRSGAGRLEVGFRAEDLLGPVYVSGKARSGKTWLLQAIAIHLARSGAGFCFVDPHADAAAELTSYLSDREDDLLLVDLARRDRQAGMNPLEVEGPEEIPDVVSRTVGAFQAAYGWTDRTHPRVLTIVRMGVQALVEANLSLPRGERATLFQLSSLLTDERFRSAVLSRSTAAVASYFLSEFPHYEPATLASVLDKVSAVRADPRTRLLLGQPTTFDPRKAMDEGSAVVVSLAGLGDKSQLVGSLLIYEFFRAAKARADTPAPQRRPFYLLCDEVQLYQGPVLAAACGEAPKYGLRLLLANQFPGHLSKEVRGAILANHSQLVCFATDHSDASLLAHELGPPVRPEDLVSLPRFTCFARLTVGTSRLPAFQARTLDLGDAFGELHRPERVQHLKGASDDRLAPRGGKAVDRSLETLEARIASRLGRDQDARATLSH